MDIRNSCIRYNSFFDSIVCDPPFGWTIKLEGIVSEIISSLFKLAKNCLVKKGNLVFLYGIDKKFQNFDLNDIL